jgi:hypothetical protein
MMDVDKSKFVDVTEVNSFVKMGKCAVKHKADPPQLMSVGAPIDCLFHLEVDIFPVLSAYYYVVQQRTSNLQLPYTRASCPRSRIL